MLTNSATAGPPHFVDLHVNPGESVSIQLFDGNETVLRGPATVTMISQHTFPPVPMPVQVPPGHMVQQIVDENGTLRHIILSAINSNGTNSSPPATLVPQQQAYPYSCCCYCYCSSMPSPNTLPTPPPPPPPPPPIHPSNLWEVGLTHVDSSRRLPFSRTNNSKVNSCNIEMPFPASPTATIRRRVPNRSSYSYSKRSPLSGTNTLNSNNATTSTTTTTTTSIGSLNNINSTTSITTTTITTTATGTSPSSNSFVVNGITSTTTITKLSSSGIISSVTSNLTAATTTSTTATATATTTVAAITTTGSSTYNNKDSGSTPIRGGTINGKSQTLTVTVSETGSVSKTGAITFPNITHLRTNGGNNMATKLTTSIPELITSTDQPTKHPQHHHHNSHNNNHNHNQHQHSHQYHSQQSAKIEFLFTNPSNNSMTSGTYNTNYNNKQNSIISNLPSSTSNHHHHHHHHHNHSHNIVTNNGNNNASNHNNNGVGTNGDNNKLMMGDSEKIKTTSHHNNKDNNSSGVLINRNTNTPNSTTTTNDLLIGSPSSPIKNVNSLTSSGNTTLTSKGSSSHGTKSSSTSSSSLLTQSSNNHHSPKNDNLSRKVRREEKINNKEDRESANKSKEITPQRKKSNIINSNGLGNHPYDGELGRNNNISGASSTSNSKESSPIKIPLNHLSHCVPTSISAINIPINVTLTTGPSTATLPIISIPMEASTFTKKRCDSLLTTTTVNSVDLVGVRNRKESKDLSSSGINSDPRNSANKLAGKNLNNQQLQQQSSSGALPISLIVNDADSLSVESPLIVIESETKSISNKSTTKSDVLKASDSNNIDDSGDNFEKDETLDEDSLNDRLAIPKKGQPVKQQKKDKPTDQVDVSIVPTNQLQKLNDKDDIKEEDSSVILNQDISNKELLLKVNDEMDGGVNINCDNTITIDTNTECKNGKSDSQQTITSTTATTTTLFNENVNSVDVHGAVDETSAHSRDNQDKDYGDKNVDDNEDNNTCYNGAEEGNHEREEEGADNDGEDEEEEDGADDGEEDLDNCQSTEENNKNNYVTSSTMMVTGSNGAAYGDSNGATGGDVNRVKAKSSPQRSPKHLLPQIQVFCLNYTSLTATSVKLKWINEQGHYNNYNNHHNHFQSSSYGGAGNSGGSSLVSETRHYMVEMIKLNRSNAKNGTVTPTTRIVYQGTQASCRVSHLTPSEQYSFRVRSSENNHQLVSNLLTLVTPEHQPANKHHKRSRAQNANQQIQFTSESSSSQKQHQQHIQNQEQAASRQQESLNNKIDGETRIIRSEQKCAIVIISLVSVLAVVLACIIHNLLMY